MFSQYHGVASCWVVFLPSTYINDLQKQGYYGFFCRLLTSTISRSRATTGFSSVYLHQRSPEAGLLRVFLPSTYINDLQKQGYYGFFFRLLTSTISRSRATTGFSAVYLHQRSPEAGLLRVFLPSTYINDLQKQGYYGFFCRLLTSTISRSRATTGFSAVYLHQRSPEAGLLRVFLPSTYINDLQKQGYYGFFFRLLTSTISRSRATTGFSAVYLHQRSPEAGLLRVFLPSTYINDLQKQGYYGFFCRLLTSTISRSRATTGFSAVYLHQRSPEAGLLRVFLPSTYINDLQKQGYYGFFCRHMQHCIPGFDRPLFL